MKWISKLLLVLLVVKIINIQSVSCQKLASELQFEGEDKLETLTTKSTGSDHERFIERSTTKNKTTFGTATPTNNCSGQSVHIQANERYTSDPEKQTSKIRRYKKSQVVRNISTSRTTLGQFTSKTTSKPKHQNNDQSELWTRYLLLWP